MYKIDLTGKCPADGVYGIESVKQVNLIPENDILCQTEIICPDFNKGAYQAYPAEWPIGSCRYHNYIFTEFDQLERSGNCCLLKTAAESFLFILCVATDRNWNYFAPQAGKLIIETTHLGTEQFTGDLPLCIWCTGNDPYELFQQAFRLAVGINGISAKLRDDKRYPEPFNYLGWCSWEEFHLNIDHEILIDAVDKIENSEIPVRYMLVDDGYQDWDSSAYFGRKLKNFTPDKSKFSNAFEELLATRKNSVEHGIDYLGLWMPFGGGMAGLSPDSKWGKLNDYLIELPCGGLFPENSAEATDAFMEAMITEAEKFDFIKVDFMGQVLNYYHGDDIFYKKNDIQQGEAIDNPYQACVRLFRSMEKSLQKRDIGLMNCNSLNPFNYWNMHESNSARCSDDYKKGSLERARAHIFQSYSVMPWLGQLCWGDHDMFHSCDEFAGRMMAVSKALSGGPVYLSDAPDAFVYEHIIPLCFGDGELIRPLAPAAPLPESLFLEYDTVLCPHLQQDNQHPYRVIAPLANESAAVCIYNLTGEHDEPALPITGYIQPKDYCAASAMLQPYSGKWQLPAEGLVIYNWYNKQPQLFNEKISFAMNTFEDSLFILAPIIHGWAIIGDVGKYLSPAAVQVISRQTDKIEIIVSEAVELLIYSISDSLNVKNGYIEKSMNGFQTIKVEKGLLVIQRDKF